MAIVSPVEKKRLKILAQLEGKPNKVAKKYSFKEIPKTETTFEVSKKSLENLIPTNQPSNSTSLDVAYLKTDLLKILLFASIAIGLQVALYIALQNGLHFGGF